MQKKLQTSLLSCNQYLEMGWAEFTKNLKIFLCLSLLVSLPMVLLQVFFLPSIDSNIIDTSSRILVILTTAPVIERSIRSQTVSISVALKNIVPKFLIALTASLVFSYGLGGLFTLPFDWFDFDPVFIIIGLLFMFILGIFSGIFSWIMLSFTYHAIALRNYRLDAFSYSWNLIKSRFWAVFWRYLEMSILFVVFMIILIVLTMPFAFGSLFLVLMGIDQVISIGVQLIISSIYKLITYYCSTINTIIFLNFDYTHTKV